MKETSKLRGLLTEDERRWFEGKVIDIGCGNDPVTPDCLAFDRAQGDASHILDYVEGQFDCVYSSHCLEDMPDPEKVVLDWWQLVKPGGMLVVCVPDEDLYEQGHMKRFNRDHAHTFTLCKRRSWSPASINVLDLVKSLPGGELVRAELQDIGYDRGKQTFCSPHPVDQTLGGAMAQIMFAVRKSL